MACIDLTGQPDVDICMMWAVMCFPNNKFFREQYHLINGTHQLLKDTNLSEFTLPRYSLELLLESPSYNDFSKLVKDNSKKGMVAGDLFSVIYLMDKFNIPEPSFNKAIHIMKEFSLRHDVKFGDGNRLPRSEQTIRDYWNEFKNAAHFWATFRLNQTYQIGAESRLSKNNYMAFLEVANGLLKFGQDFSPFRQKGGNSLLDGDMWLLPNSLSTRNLENARFPELLVDMLKNYKA